MAYGQYLVGACSCSAGAAAPAGDEPDACFVDRGALTKRVLHGLGCRQWAPPTSVWGLERGRRPCWRWPALGAAVLHRVGGLIVVLARERRCSTFGRRPWPLQVARWSWWYGEKRRRLKAIPSELPRTGKEDGGGAGLAGKKGADGAVESGPGPGAGGSALVCCCNGLPMGSRQERGASLPVVDRCPAGVPAGAGGIRCWCGWSWKDAAPETALGYSTYPVNSQEQTPRFSADLPYRSPRPTGLALELEALLLADLAIREPAGLGRTAAGTWGGPPPPGAPPPPTPAFGLFFWAPFWPFIWTPRIHLAARLVASGASRIRTRPRAGSEWAAAAAQWPTTDEPQSGGCGRPSRSTTVGCCSPDSPAA